jgi:hypothetical protein
VNHINFRFDGQSSLIGEFCGTAQGKSLIVTDDPGIVNAVEQYLDNKGFVDLKIAQNILNFSVLHLVFKNNFVEFLTEKDLPGGGMYTVGFKIYEPCDLDLILWTIITADKKFSLEKTRKEIMDSNEKFKNFRLDQLKKVTQ